MAGLGPEEDGKSIIEFDVRLKTSVDVAAFIEEIEQGDSHMTRVELVRSKPRRPTEE